MKKKLFALFVSAILLFSMSTGAFAAGSEEEDISWALDEGVLTISGTGNMENYSMTEGILPPWFDDSQSVKSVVIEPGVTGIGDYAFVYCLNLEDVNIPASVAAIGEYAFSTCEYLKDVALPEGLESIGAHAFSQCPSLKTVEIPATVTTIGEGVFESNSLQIITVAEGNPAFRSVDGVLYDTDLTVLYAYPCGDGRTDFSVPEGVVRIGASAFCSSYGTFDIEAAADSGRLQTVSIPESVTEIGGMAFNNCPDLVSITVSDDNLFFRSIDGVLFDRDGTTLLRYPAGRTQSAYAVPKGVTTIGVYAFESCHDLADVTLPTSLTAIELGAFRGCDGLTGLTIPGRVKSIGGAAFYNSGITSISIPSSVTQIGSSAFGFCKNLQTVTLPPALTKIEIALFSTCSSLESVIIPTSVTSIGDFAFNACGALTDVYYGGDEAQWAEIEIGTLNSALTDAEIHYE